MLDKNASGESCGSRALRARISEVKPRYHIFGHIHQNYGRKKYAGTEYINASLLNDNYELVNKPAVIEI
jgi:Icc-related predicted phosphoesterase